MKYVIIFLVCFLIGYLWAGKEKSKTDLEIYTKDNIYYIEGLTVTDEVNGRKKEFKNKEQLKEYISNLTVMSVQ